MADGYRCADAADRRHEQLLATASQVRAWVLVEVRGAWGVDAVHDSALAGHVPRDWRDRLKRRQARVVCIRSHLRTDQPIFRRFFVLGIITAMVVFAVAVTTLHVF